MLARMGSRVGIILTVLMILSMLLSACAPTAPAAPAPAAETGSGEAAAESGGRALPADAAADQTLHYVTRNFSRLNPASEGGFGRPFTSFMWMPFFLRDREHQVHPWLATDYTVSDDGLVYTINIHPEAVWSDGSPVVAQDAIDYWTYALSPRCVTCYTSFLVGMQLIDGAKAVIDGTADTIPGLVAVDDKTLEIHLTDPYPTFISNLAHYNTGFVKMEDVDKDEFAASASTRVNGPFMIEEWDVDAQKHVIVQNPNWWGETKPYLQKIIAQPSQDENVSFIMWQNDEVDIAHWLTNIREPLRATEPDTFVLIPYATNFFFRLYTSLEPMDDINVRRALVHAVDWDTAISAAWENARNDRVMKTHLTPELACYKADNWPDYGYDPELAKQELAASKYGSAANLPKIRITPNGQSPNYIRTAEIMIEQWKNVLGITDVEVRPGPLDAWGQEASEVQVQRASAGATIPDPAAFLSGLYKNAANPETVAINDPELDAMVEDLATVAPDAPDYCDKVQAVEAKLLGHYYILPMIWDLYEYNVKPWVKNFDTNVDNNWTGLLDMYIAEH
ncbi:MAG: ABC transporter substrate-binding protein [Caldilineaceae bacterium]